MFGRSCRGGDKAWGGMFNRRWKDNDVDRGHRSRKPDEHLRRHPDLRFSCTGPDEHFGRYPCPHVRLGGDFLRTCGDLSRGEVLVFALSVPVD